MEIGNSNKSGDEENNGIAERIRVLRGDKTQKEFAKAINIKHQYISNYENNIVNPTTDFYIKVAKALKVNINWLLLGEGEIYGTIINNKHDEEKLILKIKELEAELDRKNKMIDLLLKNSK